MSKGQKIEVNSSSIVDLKAELFRKQEEVRQKKHLSASEKASSSSSEQANNDDHLYNKNAHNISRLSKKMLGSIASHEERKNDRKSKIDKNFEATLEMKQEEELALVKSREMLEIKAKLYEKMASGSIVPDEENEEILVDFSRKAHRSQNYETSTDDEENDKEHSGDELVEYEDEFGRTRLVKRKDLPKRGSEVPAPVDRPDDNSHWNKESDLLSEDMRREIERREWEEDTRREMESSKATIHYEDVREGEIRNHGVAFFNFSADEETRVEQMKMLEQLREETASKKSEKQRIKEKRKEMLKARLAKVAARKGIALPEEPSEESDSEHEGKITIEKAKLKVEKDVVQVGRVRDWDLGKEGLFASRTTEDRAANTLAKTPFISQQRYVEKRRDERNDEFAPPSIYNEPAKASFGYGSYNNNYKRFKSYERSNELRETDNTQRDNSIQDVSSIVGDQLAQIRRNIGS